jgi:hypothetical protein
MISKSGQKVMAFVVMKPNQLPPDPNHDQQIWTKNNSSISICGHETISAASRPLNILHLGLMSDAVEWCWLLMAHGCEVMPIYGQQDLAG